MALGTVDFYTYTGDPKTANKDLGSVVASSGQIKPLEQLSNLSVLFTLDYKSAAMSCNYIGFGGMYYKIQDRKFLTGGGMEITARIDAVKSYYSQIAACPAIAARTATKGKYTLYVPDGKIKTNAYTFQETLADTESGNMFGYNAHFVLITVG